MRKLRIQCREKRKVLESQGRRSRQARRQRKHAGLTIQDRVFALLGAGVLRYPTNDFQFTTSHEALWRRRMRERISMEERSGAERRSSSIAAQSWGSDGGAVVRGRVRGGAARREVGRMRSEGGASRATARSPFDYLFDVTKVFRAAGIVALSRDVDHAVSCKALEMSFGSSERSRG